MMKYNTHLDIHLNMYSCTNITMIHMIDISRLIDSSHMEISIIDRTYY